MKSSRSLYSIALMLLSMTATPVHAAQPTQSSMAYPQETTSPQERECIAKILDEHFDEIANKVLKQLDCKEFPWLPGYYIKNNYFSRIDGAKTLSLCIKKQKLNLVTVPEKWLYTIPHKHKPTPFAQESIIVAKKIEGAHRREMNLSQAQQVCCLLKHAKYSGKHYSDTHDTNLLFCPDGRVAFIDTETKGFYHSSPLAGLMSLLQWHTLDSEASSFIEQQVAQVKEHYPEENTK